MDTDLAQVSSIHQIFISDDDASEIGGTAIADFVGEIRRIYPNAAYRLWNNRDLRVFLAERFSPSVLGAYDTLVPYAFKADLARYCLMYEFGGLYSDLANLFVRPLRIWPGRKVAIFRDLGSGPWGLQQGVIFAEPRRKEFKLAIRTIVRHCAVRFYGAGSTEPTGPMMYGRCFAICNDVASYSIGQWESAVPAKPGATVAFTDYAGGVFALWRKQAPGQLAEFGLTGVNNYNRIWAQRRAYGEREIRVPLHAFSFKDGALGPTGLRLDPSEGCQLWGPYVELGRGRYLANLRFRDLTVGGSVRLDVASGFGAIVHATAPLSPEPSGACTATLAFELDKDEGRVEIRLHNDGHFGGILEEVELIEAP